MAQAMAPTATTDCEILMRLFLNAEGLAPSAKQVMIEGLPHAIRVNDGKPHPFQSQFIGIVTDLLNELSRDTEPKLRAHTNSLEVLEKQVEEGKAAYDAAMMAMEDVNRQTQEMSAHLKECEEAIKVTQVEHEQSLLEKNEVDETKNALEISKAKATSILEGPFQLLLEGQCGEAGHKEALNAVKVFLKNLRTEPALIAAAAKALANKPADRGEFDLFTLASVKQTIETEIDKNNTLISDRESRYESVTAEQLGLWALLDHERDRKTKAQASLAEMELSLKSAQDLCTSAHKELAARSEAVSQKLCERVLVDNMAKDLVSAREAVARLAAFCYETADTSTADTAEALDVSMAAATA